MSIRIKLFAIGLVLLASAAGVAATTFWPQVTKNQRFHYAYRLHVGGVFKHDETADILATVQSATSEAITWQEARHESHGHVTVTPTMRLTADGAITDSVRDALPKVRIFFNPIFFGRKPNDIRQGDTWSVRYAVENSFGPPGMAGVRATRVDGTHELDLSMDFAGAESTSAINPGTGETKSAKNHVRAHGVARFVDGVLLSWKITGIQLQQFEGQTPSTTDFEITQTLSN